MKNGKVLYKRENKGMGTLHIFLDNFVNNFERKEV